MPPSPLASRRAQRDLKTFAELYKRLLGFSLEGLGATLKLLKTFSEVDRKGIFRILLQRQDLSPHLILSSFEVTRESQA